MCSSKVGCEQLPVEYTTHTYTHTYTHQTGSAPCILPTTHHTTAHHCPDGCCAVPSAELARSSHGRPGGSGQPYGRASHTPVGSSVGCLSCQGVCVSVFDRPVGHLIGTRRPSRAPCLPCLGGPRRETSCPEVPYRAPFRALASAPAPGLYLALMDLRTHHHTPYT